MGITGQRATLRHNGRVFLPDHIIGKLSHCVGGWKVKVKFAACAVERRLRKITAGRSPRRICMTPRVRVECTVCEYSLESLN